MKRCLVIFFIFTGLATRVCGQSASAAIDSLIKFKIITIKQRPELEKQIKIDSTAPYRVAILRRLRSIMLQKEFHINPNKGMYFTDFEGGSPNKKSQDSVNQILRPLLENINKAGLLTERVYTRTKKGIDSGIYVLDVQMIGFLTEMSARLERLAPNKLLPVADELHKNGIVSDSSYLRLKVGRYFTKMRSTIAPLHLPSAAH